MPRGNQTEVPFRIVIENPVPGVRHSLQSGDAGVLDAKPRPHKPPAPGGGAKARCAASSISAWGRPRGIMRRNGRGG